MSDDTARLVEAAWRAMWQEGTRYYVPQAMERGITAKRVRVRPFRNLKLANIGPVTLFHEPPHEGVAIDLTHNRVHVPGRARSDGFEFDPESGRLKAHVEFPEVVFSSFYLVHAAARSASAVRLAADTLGMDAVSGDSPQIALAKQKQDTLLGSDGGAHAVAQYWNHNESYNHVFTYDNKLKYHWVNTPTGGKTTKVFATQTFSAAQPGATAPVQGSVSSNGYSDYTAHSWLQATNLTFACDRARDAASTTEEKNRFTAAASAVFGFKSATAGAATTPTTVDHVMSKVAAGTPAGGLEADVAVEREEPEWIAEVHRRAEELNRAPLPTGEEDYQGALTAPLATHRRTPARGTIEDQFSMCDLVLEGRVADHGEPGPPSVVFTSLQGSLPELKLELSPFEGDLFAKVRSAVDGSDFLRDAVTQRVHAALVGERFLEFLARVMNLALSGELGPVVLSRGAKS